MQESDKNVATAKHDDSAVSDSLTIKISPEELYRVQRGSNDEALLLSSDRFQTARIFFI